MLREKEVDIRWYMPAFLAKIEEYKVACEASNPEFRSLWGYIQDFLDNQFVATANADGIARFERMARVNPVAGSSLEERRMVLAAYFYANTKQGKNSLKQYLKEVLGSAFVALDIDYPNHRITLTMDLVHPTIRDSVFKRLRAMAPAASEVEVVIKKRNTYASHKNKTYNELKGYTYEELSNLNI